MLKDTILKFLKIDGFLASLTGYVETRAELLKIEIKEEVAKSLSKMSLLFVLILFFLVSVMFLSVALAFWIGQSTGSMVGGFAIVGGVYLLLAIIMFLLKEQISQRLEKKLMEIVKQKK